MDLLSVSGFDRFSPILGIFSDQTSLQFLVQLIGPANLVFKTLDKTQEAYQHEEDDIIILKREIRWSSFGLTIVTKIFRLAFVYVISLL